MMTTDTMTVLDAMAPISLGDLQRQAEFLTRKDRKYLVPVNAVGHVLAGLAATSRVLEDDSRRSFCYETHYFDGEHFASYLGALRRRPNRFKVRTRLYRDSGWCQLEVKLRDARGQTVKHRRDHDRTALTGLTEAERAWLGTFSQVGDHAPALHHRITTVYCRSTLMLPDGAGRVTIDHDLAFTLPGGKRLALPSIAIVETKGPGNPTLADRVLWRQGLRPVSMSKFTVGLSLLVPELPANRWHRVRERLGAIAVAGVPGVDDRFNV